MSVNIEELDPKFEVELLKRFDLGTVKIGDRIPYLEQHMTVVSNLKHATPPYRELTVTKKLIQALKVKYHMFIVTAVETKECGIIAEESILEKFYLDHKRHLEEHAESASNLREKHFVATIQIFPNFTLNLTCADAFIQ